MSISPSALVLLLAAIEDYVIGDPWGWLHPVQVMGWLIQRYTDIALKLLPSRWLRRASGIFLGLVLIAGSGTLGWLIVNISKTIYPLLGHTVETILLASCFAGKSLRLAVQDVLQSIN
ncbi:MAG: cobalamin biosynthesis protein, partial [Pleurocapsa sp.]